MVTIDQELWNLFFGLKGNECMLPEGCTAPISGVIVYIAVFITLGIIIHWRKRARDQIGTILEKAVQKV